MAGQHEVGGRTRQGRRWVFVAGAAVAAALVMGGPALAQPDDPGPQGPIDTGPAPTVPKRPGPPSVPDVDPTGDPNGQPACIIKLCPPPPSGPLQNL